MLAGVRLDNGTKRIGKCRRVINWLIKKKKTKSHWFIITVDVGLRIPTTGMHVMLEVSGYPNLFNRKWRHMFENMIHIKEKN